MASIRRLKKDVDYLTFAVIADCMNYNSSVGKSEPEVVNIVKKMVEYRNETRSKISARKSFNDKKEYRKEFPVNSIRFEYLYDINQLIHRHLLRLQRELQQLPLQGNAHRHMGRG